MVWKRCNYFRECSTLRRWGFCQLVMFLYRDNKASCSSNVPHSGVYVYLYVCMYTSYSETPAIPPATARSPLPYYTYIAVLVLQYCPIYQLHNHSALTPATSEDYIKSFGYKVEMFKTTDRCFVQAKLHIQSDAKVT